MSTINIRESLRQLDDDSFCKYDLLTMYDSCPLLDEDKQEIAKLLYDKEDSEVIYQKLCTYFCDDDTSEIDAFNDFVQPGTFEIIVNECVNKLKESCSDAQYNDVANQLEVIKDGELYTTGLAPIEIETGDIEIFVDGNYDSPLSFDSTEDAVNYITNVVLNKLTSTSVDSGDDDIMVYTVYDIVEDDDNRLTAKCMNESTNDFQDIKLGKINSKKVNELLNNMLNNPNYKITDEVKKKIYDKSAPWGLAVQMTPAVDVDGTNGLLSTGDFGGEASFGESIETNFEKDDRVTDGDRQGTVLDYDSQKVLVEWDYSETDDIEWVDKSMLELVNEINSRFLPNMGYCPACGGTRFNTKTGVCIDCGYNEGGWGYTSTDDYDDLDESKNTIATGKEGRKYLWSKIKNSKDSRGYWKIEDDFINGGDITVVKDVSDVPNGYKYRFSFLDDENLVEMDAYNNDLNWCIVDYLSDVKLEESVSGRYVWFDYNDIKDVKPKPQQVIDAYNHKYPDYDNLVTGIKEIEFAGRNYPEKEIHYIVTDNEGNQFWAVVGNLSKEIDESHEDDIEPQLPTFNELRKQYKNYTTFKDKEKNSGLIRDLCDQLENKKIPYDIYNHKKDNGMTIFYDDCELVESTKVDSEELEAIVNGLDENGYNLNVLSSIKEGLWALFGYQGKDAFDVVEELVTKGYIDSNVLIDAGYTPTSLINESLSPYKKEEFKKQLQDELYDKFIDLARTPEWGFENLAEIGDYLIPTIEVNDYEGEYDNDIEVEFRAEVNYREMEDVCNTLDKVVKKYDKNAYFEPVQPGIAVAYLKLKDSIHESKGPKADKLRELIDEGVISKDLVVDEFINYLSEDDIQDFLSEYDLVNELSEDVKTIFPEDMYGLITMRSENNPVLMK